MSENGACNPLPKANYSSQRGHRSQLLPAVYNVTIYTCESCVSEGVQLPSRKADAADLEPSAFVVGDPEERQDRRLDQRGMLAWGGKPSEAQADHEKKPRC